MKILSTFFYFFIVELPRKFTQIDVVNRQVTVQTIHVKEYAKM